ncbi:hypothetical protein D3C78_1102650 [compost metagenome]
MQALAQLVFAGVVHVAGGFVENHDWWLQQHRSGEQHRLALTTGKQLAALAHRTLEPLRMLARQFTDAGQLSDFKHARIADIARAEGEVVTQAAGQQRQVVSHIADLVAQVSYVELAQVEVVEQDLPFIRGVKAHQQSGQGTFARTAAADDTDALARLDAEAHRIEGGDVLPGIAKADMTDLNGAAQLGAFQGLLASLPLLRQRHQRVGAAHGQLRLLIAGDQAGNLPQRRQHPAAEHIAGDQGANAEVAGNDAVNPGDNGGHATKLLNEQRAVGRQC